MSGTGPITSGTVVMSPERYTELYHILESTINTMELSGFTLPEIEVGFLAFLANWAACQRADAVATKDRMKNLLETYFAQMRDAVEEMRKATE